MDNLQRVDNIKYSEQIRKTGMLYKQRDKLRLIEKDAADHGSTSGKLARGFSVRLLYKIH